MRKLEKELKQAQAGLLESRAHVTRLEAALTNERNSLALARERNDRHVEDIRALQALIVTTRDDRDALAKALRTFAREADLESKRAEWKPLPGTLAARAGSISFALATPEPK